MKKDFNIISLAKVCFYYYYRNSFLCTEDSSLIE